MIVTKLNLVPKASEHTESSKGDRLTYGETDPLFYAYIHFIRPWEC